MITEIFTRPKHDFTRLGWVDRWLGRTLQYLALTGELWDYYLEYFGEYWQSNIALHCTMNVSADVDDLVPQLWNINHDNPLIMLIHITISIQVDRELIIMYYGSPNGAWMEEIGLMLSWIQQ